MDGLDCVSFHSYPPTPLNVLLCKSNEADLIFRGNESSIEPEKILCVTSEDLKPAKESISEEEMLQNLKLFQSSLNLHSSLQQPNPLFKNQAILSSSPCSIHIKQSCNLSRRELAIFSNSSLLLLLSPHFLEPLNQSKARAEEIFPGTNVENDQQEAIAGQIFPDTDVQNDQQQVRAEEFVPDTNVGNDQQDARAEQVSPDTNVENGQQEARADAAIENDQQESSADEILPDTVVENDQQEAKTATNILHCSKTPTKRAFLDISIDGQPAGRIVIGLYGQDVPAGAARFSSLVSGAAGISYRRKEFIKIMQNYVQHGGVRSYSVDAELARQIGSNLAAETLMDEWGREYERCPGVKNAAGTVSIIVRDPLKPPPKLKLVARKGKLEIDQEEVGTDPNGTEFVIAIKDSPELDTSALVVGRVLEGMEVVERIGQVKTVQENTGSPYFRVAKVIGDKRAVVAERGFNRPYSKVLVTNCGLME